MGIGCDTLASGSQVVHAAQARVLDIGSFDVNGLKLLSVFLVDECDGDVVGSAELSVMKGEHFSTLEETNATQQKDFGLLAVAAWSVQVFAAPKAEEQCGDHERHRYSIQQSVRYCQQVGQQTERDGFFSFRWWILRLVGSKEIRESD